MTIHENIEMYRKQCGMTLEELGLKVGVSKPTIKRYETGEISNIPYDKIIALSNAFNISPAQLMGWDEKSSPIIKQATEFALRQKKIDKLPPEAITELDNYIDYLLSKYSE